MKYLYSAQNESAKWQKIANQLKKYVMCKINNI